MSIVLLRLVAALTILHVLDDSFLQPEPGTAATDHLAGGLVPAVLLGGAALLAGRLGTGARAVVAMGVGLAGIVAGVEGTYAALHGGGPARDDYAGIAGLLGGAVLLVVAGVEAWRNRRRNGRWLLRRALLTVLGLAVAAGGLSARIRIRGHPCDLAAAGLARPRARGGGNPGRRRRPPSSLVCPVAQRGGGDHLPRP